MSFAMDHSRDDAVIDYLRSGVEAGMELPDPADPQIEQIRVVTSG
jgi:hypothetical protein